MITKSELIKKIRSMDVNIDYDEDTNSLVIKDSRKIVQPFDDYLWEMRRKMGQSFNCIYDEHVSLFSVIECTECGTVIFTYDDERCEFDLRCPTCTEYNTGFEFWTREDIALDSDKHRAIQQFHDMAAHQKEYYERIERRGGKLDSELVKNKKIFKTSKGYWDMSICIDSITNEFKLKGLYLKFQYWKKHDEYGHVWKKQFIVPLSGGALYRYIIYQHLGKCHPDIRSKWFIGKPIELSWPKK